MTSGVPLPRAVDLKTPDAVKEWAYAFSFK